MDAHTFNINVEATATQYEQLRKAADKHERLILIVDAYSIAVPDFHSEAWMKAKKLAVATWASELNND